MMLIIGKTLGAYVLPGLSRSFESWLVSVQGTAAMPDLYAIWPLNTEQPMWHMLLWTTPHSASTFQTLTGLGYALLVVGILFFVPKITTAVLVPFAGVGRVALTMYAVQFAVIWLLTLSGINHSLGKVPFGDLLVASMALIIGWLISLLPHGPLESSMRRFDRLFSASRTEPAPK
uniref:DUF418 domain-containing protein n=1 Tax=Paenibacillus sp. FSL W8-0194 TaxID=2921711 RepID=UPI00403E59E1